MFRELLQYLKNRVEPRRTTWQSSEESQTVLLVTGVHSPTFFIEIIHTAQPKRCSRCTKPLVVTKMFLIFKASIKAS